MNHYSHEQPKAKVKVFKLGKTMPRFDASLTDKVAAYLRSRQLSAYIARYNGWYGSREAGDSAPRVVIPCTSGIPGHCFWQARSMNGSEPRYQSPHCSRGDAIVLVYPPPSEPIVGCMVCEGPMDALAAAELGFKSIALMGNTPPESALDFTSQRIYGRIVVLADLDAAEAMSRVLSQLSSRKPGDYTLIQPAPAKDLAGASPELRRKLLNVT